MSVLAADRDQAAFRVDKDHVTGLLDLFVELRSAKEEREKPLVRIAELWHNTFGLLDTRGDIATRFSSIMASAQALMSSSGSPSRFAKSYP